MSAQVLYKEILFGGVSGLMATDPSFNYDPSTKTLSVTNLSAGSLSFDAQTITNLTVTGNTTLGDAAGDTITIVGTTTFTGKYTGTLYNNDSGKSTTALKVHNHLTTAGTSVEFRGETVNTSGAYYGLNLEAHIAATGTGSVFGLFGASVVDSTFTVTGGTIIGTYGQARADGIVAGSSFMAGVYGLVEASAAITASHVASIWADSHQANAVTGEHELIYASNNGAAQMDSVMYVYGGNKITNLFKLSTVTGMVSAIGGTLTATKKILIDIDGTPLYLVAGTVA